MLDVNDLVLSYNRRSNLVGGRGYSSVLYQISTVKYRTRLLSYQVIESSCESSKI